MPSVNYYNQTAPFWDWVAGLEERGPNHPLFGGADRGDQEQQRFNPWTQDWSSFPFGPMPQRGRRGGPGHPGHHHGPAHPHPPPHNWGEGHGPEATHPPEGDQAEAHHSGSDTEIGHEGPSMRGRCRGRGRGGLGGRGRGGLGGRGRDGFPFANPGAMGGWGTLAGMFQDQLFGNGSTEKENEELKPEADVFDTPEAFVVHVSLPGAKKEDIGVNWDQEKSELSIGGVIYRPGGEELLQTLALDERKVGAFERKLRLGSRANPAQVDVDAITAKLEDGILRVEVPKMDSGYVEVKKVDIE
ncbi:hypothetical protein KC343_g5728 [Hortaea werneckii]|uniref:SHSP domain-containing protein n=1 Tax=Hortaea werneckii TaxID=91943 RepID=A0A3M7G9D1_HORWE|nr:hypothetical protein KC352_g15778 [Hortaea werneckii]KAI7572467.1 hypothetical protein KC317_g731 [Hortaea werneckii]KAI7612711.1 hypothetical protein KC346_g7685 [Hortaea werneckii]KAI7628363.1 hypothetical protein KC343_g5728 [Hortaea werneckii]KAI7666005.1 hypothetical protein KC319_g7067 [Hortaea werneckii]